MTRTRVLISGRVQAVFFRQGAWEQAKALGLGGWVTNLPDGRVEAVFEGPAERVDEAVAWCRQGPPWADVESIETHDEDPEGLDDFYIR